MTEPTREDLDLIGTELKHQALELRRLGCIREAGLVDHVARSLWDRVDSGWIDRGYTQPGGVRYDP
jgi:hypothetical protein